MAHDLKMFVHAVQPVFQPAQAGFQEGDAQVWMPLQHAAADDIQTGGHLFERMTDHVGKKCVLVAAVGEAGHVGAKAAVHGGEQALFAQPIPERRQHLVMQGQAIVTLGPESDTL